MMADEEKKEEEQQEGGSKKGGKTVLIIIGALLFLIIVIGGVVAFMLLSGDDGAAQQPQGQNVQNPASKAPAVRSDDLTVGPMFPLEPFTVNLLSESGRRYLKAEVNLEMSTANLQAELTSKMPVIRDTVITVLSSKTVEEISTARGKERLKEELIEQLNLRLQDGYINRIYFMMFIVQ
jgi:flagellar FliL protein